MIDEWSSEVTPAFERMLTEVSTVHTCFLVFWCILSARVLLNVFLFWLKGGSYVNFAIVYT